MDMSLEVIEAIHAFYKNEPDLEAECYVYLKKIGDIFLQVKCEKQLIQMKRCPKCGSILIPFKFKEFHGEIQEIQNILICPICSEV